ncbi:MAG: phage terminase large subunit [Flavobacteriales bacterium]|jgi:phage terminase large subunit
MNWQSDYLPKQIEALHHLSGKSDAELVLYGGSAGSGKSWLGCRWQIMRRLKYTGTRGLIGRSKLDTLKKTTLRTFFEVCGQLNLVSGKHYTFNAQANIITFHNGSEIILKDLFSYPSDPNFDSLGSLEITDYFIDEVAQVTKKAVDIVSSRLRFKLNEYGLKPKGLMTCNPSRGWLYNEFYEPWKNGSLPHYRVFVPALPGDNTHLPETYLDTLSRLPEQDRKRLRDGDWDYDESIDRIYNLDDLLRCFRSEILSGEKYVTADIARLGKDRTVIAYWEGMTLVSMTILRRARTDEVSAKVREIVSAKQVPLRNVIADEDGVGGGVVDALKCRGFMNGSRAVHPERYINLKAECYFKLGELIEQNKITFICGYRDEIVKELDLIRRKNPDGDGKLSVTSKDEIARVHGFSPDLADAIMMRMYFELRPNYGVYSVGGTR